MRPWHNSSFCDGLLEHVFVQGQIRNKLLQPAILFFQLFELPQFGHAHPGKLLPPSEERGLGDAELARSHACDPADLHDGNAGVGKP
jgi:hypothetical protein